MDNEQKQEGDSDVSSHRIFAHRPPISLDAKLTEVKAENLYFCLENWIVYICETEIMLTMTVFSKSAACRQDNDTAFPAMIEWAAATNRAIAPMEFPYALHYLMKGQKMTVEHLEETSLISTRTIIRLSSDPDYGVTREYIVALSVGLALPPIIRFCSLGPYPQTP